tara:strand:+ start:402 stop:626 length:225 start_codon:yes stop_codon:yes gene_type:complete
MSESSAGDSSAVKVLHWTDCKVYPFVCRSCGKTVNSTDSYTTEVLLYNNPPEGFIQCTPPNPQQELDLEGEPNG